MPGLNSLSMYMSSVSHHYMKVCVVANISSVSISLHPYMCGQSSLLLIEALTLQLCMTIESYDYNHVLLHPVPTLVDQQIAARYGAFSFTYNGCFYIIGGSREDFEEDSATVLECFSLQDGWQMFPLKGERAPRGWCGIQGAIVDQCLYIFGGWCGDSFDPSRRNSSVRCINLESHELTTVSPLDQACLPMRKDKYGCVEQDKVLYVFGGYGRRLGLPAVDSDFHLDMSTMADWGWTNEFHSFDLSTSE